LSQSIKEQLKPALLAVLDEEIQAALNGAKQAQETASHEDNKPENQYDTLALEAAYLAHGQSERIRELQQTRIRIAQWTVNQSDDDHIGNGALVKLETEDAPSAQRWLWISPTGGRQLLCDDKIIQVISTQAPLAQQLMRLVLEDEVLINQQTWLITGIW